MILKVRILEPYRNVIIAEVSGAAFHALPVVKPISLALKRRFFLCLFTLWRLTAILGHKVNAISIWNPVTWHCQNTPCHIAMNCTMTVISWSLLNMP